MNKLIINGDAWGEFTGSTKKKDGNIEIRGYRSYDTLHTVRVMDHPDGLNRNQQIVLDWLKSYYRDDNNNPTYPVKVLYDFQEGEASREVTVAYEKLSFKEEYELLLAFAEQGLLEVAE